MQLPQTRFAGKLDQATALRVSAEWNIDADRIAVVPLIFRAIGRHRSRLTLTAKAELFVQTANVSVNTTRSAGSAAAALVRSAHRFPLREDANQIAAISSGYYRPSAVSC